MRTALAAAARSAAASAAAIERSPALRAEFMRQQRCPSTGATRGARPDWPCGSPRSAGVREGRDELRDLQWLDIAARRAKTKVEVKLCRGR